MWRLPSDERGVALTFDDGPDPVHTPEILDVLAKNQIKATFFVIGNKAQNHPELLERMRREGHSIGGHSYDHRVIVDRTLEDLNADLTLCKDCIRSSAGIDTNLFRPPKGRIDIRSLRQVCGLGYKVVHWSVTYSDFMQDGTDPLIQRMKQRPLRPGDIALLHDHNAYTTQALAHMIPIWHAEKIEFLAL